MRLGNDRLAAVAVLLGLLLVVGGFMSEASRAEAVEPAAAPLGSAPAGGAIRTPLLSARRVPDLLVAPQAARRLRSRIAPVLDGLPKGRCLMILDGDRTVLEEQPDTPLQAASNQKILTAVAALDVLGPDSTLSTEIAAGAPPVGGVVEGDLWMIGGGDPLIDSDTYQAAQKYGRAEHTSIEAIADLIKAEGVTSITGSVRGDESVYDSLRVVPTWPDRFRRQNQVGPLSGLSVNDARSYAVIPGAPTGTPQPAANPPLYAADALSQLLVARGVAVAGPPGVGVAPERRSAVVSIPSLPMSKIVAEMLTFSDNNTAELLVKQLGVAAGGDGTTAAGLDAVRAALTSRDLPMTGVTVADGTGLDPANRVTCRLLAAALTDDGPDGPISKGLPVADGDVGTLRDRFTASPAAGRVRAKTGTIRSVTALSGWVRTEQEAEIVFSIVLNTGERDVTESDLVAQQRVTEAILSYPESIDPATVEPLPPSS